VIEVKNAVREICGRPSFDDLCHAWRAKQMERTTKSRSVRTRLEQVTLAENDIGVTRNQNRYL
jgi:hypothetical protein